MRNLILVVGCLAVGWPARAAAPPRQEAVISMDYHGNRVKEFAPLADYVRLQIRQLPLQIATKLGLVQFQGGYRYPLTVQFADKVRLADDEFEPRDLENAPALLRFVPGSDGAYRQDLTLNANVYFDRRQEFDRVLNRQMAFVVLNDAMGPASLNLPNWVRQGLATYASGGGDELLHRAASQDVEDFRREQGTSAKPSTVVRPRRFVQDLDGEFTSRSQSQYFLAIQFILKQGGESGLQNFVRNLVDGKSVSDALDQAIGMDLDDFKLNLRSYSAQVFADLTK